jgi:hypothetical protein
VTLTRVYVASILFTSVIFNIKNNLYSLDAFIINLCSVCNDLSVTAVRQPKIDFS